MEIAIAITGLGIVILVFWCFFQYALIDPAAPQAKPSIFAQLFSVTIGSGLFIGSQTDLTAELNHALLGFIVIAAIAPPKYRERTGKSSWKHWLEGIPDRLRRLAAHKIFGLIIWVLAIIFAPPNWTVLTALAVIPIMHFKTAEIFEVLGLPIASSDGRRTPWIVRSWVSVIAFLLIWAVGVYGPSEMVPTTTATWSTVAGIGLGSLVSGFFSD
jgi:hypothetical protein